MYICTITNESLHARWEFIFHLLWFYFSKILSNDNNMCKIDKNLLLSLAICRRKFIFLYLTVAVAVSLLLFKACYFRIKKITIKIRWNADFSWLQYGLSNTNCGIKQKMNFKQKRVNLFGWSMNYEGQTLNFSIEPICSLCLWAIWYSHLAVNN